MSHELDARFETREIGAYLAALRSAEPAPGGGSAAGLSGAMGCCLGEMVCNLTLAKESSADVTDLRDTLGRLQKDLIQLAERDEQVFAAYRKATTLPRSSDDEKRVRRDAIERSLVVAAEIPMEMITAGLAGIETLHLVARVGTIHALGDLLTGGYLLQAMVLGSLENVGANASLMKSAEHRTHFTQAAESAIADLGAAMAQLEDSVAARRS